jgi:hypothetical protein
MYAKQMLTAGLREKEERVMKDVYFTLTGTRHYYGKDFIKKGMNQGAGQ